MSEIDEFFTTKRWNNFDNNTSNTPNKKRKINTNTSHTNNTPDLNFLFKPRPFDNPQPQLSQQSDQSSYNEPEYSLPNLPTRSFPAGTKGDGSDGDEGGDDTDTLEELKREGILSSGGFAAFVKDKKRKKKEAKGNELAVGSSRWGEENDDRGSGSDKQDQWGEDEIDELEQRANAAGTGPKTNKPSPSPSPPLPSHREDDDLPLVQESFWDFDHFLWPNTDNSDDRPSHNNSNDKNNNASNSSNIRKRKGRDQDLHPDPGICSDLDATSSTTLASGSGPMGGLSSSPPLISTTTDGDEDYNHHNKEQQSVSKTKLSSLSERKSRTSPRKADAFSLAPPTANSTSAVFSTPAPSVISPAATTTRDNNKSSTSTAPTPTPATSTGSNRFRPAAPTTTPSKNLFSSLNLLGKNKASDPFLPFGNGGGVLQGNKLKERDKDTGVGLQEGHSSTSAFATNHYNSDERLLRDLDSRSSSREVGNSNMNNNNKSSSTPNAKANSNNTNTNNTLTSSRSILDAGKEFEFNKNKNKRNLSRTEEEDEDEIEDSEQEPELEFELDDIDEDDDFWGELSGGVEEGKKNKDRGKNEVQDQKLRDEDSRAGEVVFEDGGIKKRIRMKERRWGGFDDGADVDDNSHTGREQEEHNAVRGKRNSGEGRLKDPIQTPIPSSTKDKQLRITTTTATRSSETATLVSVPSTVTAATSSSHKMGFRPAGSRQQQQQQDKGKEKEKQRGKEVSTPTIARAPSAAASSSTSKASSAGVGGHQPNRSAKTPNGVEIEVPASVTVVEEEKKDQGIPPRTTSKFKTRSSSTSNKRKRLIIEDDDEENNDGDTDNNYTAGKEKEDNDRFGINDDGGGGFVQDLDNLNEESLRILEEEENLLESCFLCGKKMHPDELQAHINAELDENPPSVNNPNIESNPDSDDEFRMNEEEERMFREMDIEMDVAANTAAGDLSTSSMKSGPMVKQNRSKSNHCGQDEEESSSSKYDQLLAELEFSPHKQRDKVKTTTTTDQNARLRRRGDEDEDDDEYEDTDSDFIDDEEDVFDFQDDDDPGKGKEKATTKAKPVSRPSNTTSSRRQLLSIDDSDEDEELGSRSGSRAKNHNNPFSTMGKDKTPSPGGGGGILRRPGSSSPVGQVYVDRLPAAKRTLYMKLANPKPAKDAWEDSGIKLVDKSRPSSGGTFRKKSWGNRTGGRGGRGRGRYSKGRSFGRKKK